MTVALNIHPYCNCITRGVAQKQDGFSLDHPSGLWVCSRCRKPSKMNYERFTGRLAQIPQYRKELDIYDFELNYEFRQKAPRIIAAELDWDDDPETDYEYDD